MNSHKFLAREKTLNLGETTALMGILNITPDSFYKQSRIQNVESAIQAGLAMAQEGAKILDLGAESTRPGATAISSDEECGRLLPVLKELRAVTDVMISIDTRKASVAQQALNLGADIINDISALADPFMADVVASYNAGLTIMHMRGEPSTMQENPSYSNVVSEVKTFLATTVQKAESSGISSKSIFIDPGIGFGKNTSHNLKLLKYLSAFNELKKPILVGTSRKSFIGHLVGKDPNKRLFGTAASVAVAILNGAHVVRVHDVLEMQDVAIISDAIREPASVSRRPLSW